MVHGAQGGTVIAEKKELSREDARFVSEFDRRCQGARDPNTYLVALNVAAAKTKKRFSQEGTGLLDGINAFDLAEIDRMNMGQLNVIEVSSFCGPEGLFWGHDVATAPGLRDKSLFALSQWDGVSVPVFDGEPLIAAAATLFGTVKEKRFPLAPGTLCPAAIKSITSDSPGIIYSACGIGMRDQRDANATMLMEDVGMFSTRDGDAASRKARVQKSVAESVMAIADNQQIRCSGIFVAYAEIRIEPGETGCALVMLPYFTLARMALPSGGVSRLREMTSDEWYADRRNQI